MALRERLEREHCGRGNAGSQTEELEDIVLLDGDEDGQTTTIVRIVERDTRQRTKREIEMDEKTWEMFQEWLKENMRDN